MSYGTRVTIFQEHLLATRHIARGIHSMKPTLDANGTFWAYVYCVGDWGINWDNLNYRHYWTWGMQKYTPTIRHLIQSRYIVIPEMVEAREGYTRYLPTLVYTP